MPPMMDEHDDCELQDPSLTTIASLGYTHASLVVEGKADISQVSFFTRSYKLLFTAYTRVSMPHLIERRRCKMLLQDHLLVVPPSEEGDLV